MEKWNRKEVVLMFKKSLALILLFFMFFTSTSAVLASRVLVVPTADSLGTGVGELAYSYHRNKGSLELNVGLYPGVNLGMRQEFGGSLFGTLKVAILEETQNRPAFALGGELTVGKTQHIYAVLSKQLGTPGVRGHLALGTGRYSRGMAGVSLMLNPVQIKNNQGLTLPTTSLILEYDGKGLNGGITAQFNSAFQGYVAVATEHGLGFGLDYKLAF